MRTDDSRAAEGLFFKSLDKDSEAARRAWESRERAAPEAEASEGIDSKLGKLQYGDKVALPGLKWGDSVVQNFKAVYVGDKKGNRTYRILDHEDRFVWNLSHKRLMSVLQTKDLQGAVDMEKAEAPVGVSDPGEAAKKAWEARHAALGLKPSAPGKFESEHGPQGENRKKAEAVGDHLSADGFKRLGVKHPETDTEDRRVESWKHPDGRKVHVAEVWDKKKRDDAIAAGARGEAIPSKVEVHHVDPKAAKAIDEDIASLAKQDDSDEVKACVKRKIPIIAEEHPEWEQAQVVAVAFSMCREAAGEKSLGEALLPPWVKSSKLKVRDDSRP